MSLKYGTSTVTDVKYRVNSINNIVTVIQDASGTVYYARPGRLIIDNPTGVTAMTVTRTGGLEPTESTGVLINNAPIYHGDVLEIRPTMEPGYRATYPTSTTVDFISTTSFVASSVLQISAAEYSVTIPAASHATITYQYQAPGSPTVTTATTLDTTVAVWGQTTFTYTWAPATYYKITSESTGSFQVTQDTTIPTVTVAQKQRNITINNPHKLANISIYADGVCVASTTSYTNTFVAATIVSESGITYNTTDYRYDSDAVWYNHPTGNYPAADDERDIYVIFGPHTFMLGTYDCGTITYYNGSTAITLGTVAGYNVYTYKLTAKNNGYFLHNGAYTRTITGTLNTKPSDQYYSVWRPFAEQDVYYKLDIKTYHRGAIYYAANAHFVKVADNSPITTHSFSTYVKEGDTVQSYADYVNTTDKTDGTYTNYYGDPGDTYVDSSSAQSTTITGNTTITYSGTLTARTVHVQPRYGFDKLNGNYKYYDTSGNLKTYTWSGASSALTTTYAAIPSVWRGSYITATYSRSSTRYTYVSGFDSRGPNTSATTYTLCASYDNLDRTVSNSGNATNVSIFNVGGAGYYVINGKLANSSTQITLTYPSTSYSYSGYKLTATYTLTSTTLLVTATFSGANTYNPKTITVNVYDLPQPSVFMDSDWGGRTNQIVAYVANPTTMSLRLNYQMSCTYFNPSTDRLETMTSSSRTTTISGQATPTGIYSVLSSSISSDCTIYSYSITCSFTNTTVGFTGKSITKTYERPVAHIHNLLATQDPDRGGWIRIEADAEGRPTSMPTSYESQYRDYIIDCGVNGNGKMWFKGYFCEDRGTAIYTYVSTEELDLPGYGDDFYDVWDVNDDPHYFRVTRSSIEDGESLGVYLSRILGL